MYEINVLKEYGTSCCVGALLAETLKRKNRNMKHVKCTQIHQVRSSSSNALQVLTDSKGYQSSCSRSGFLLDGYYLIFDRAGNVLPFLTHL